MHNSLKNKDSNSMQVWFCQHCQCVHLQTPNLSLNFSKSEFVQLTHAVVEIYQENIGVIKAANHADLDKDKDEILSSNTIA